MPIYYVHYIHYTHIPVILIFRSNEKNTLKLNCKLKENYTYIIYENTIFNFIYLSL